MTNVVKRWGKYLNRDSAAVLVRGDQLYYTMIFT